jgi:rubrerythrin
MSLTVMSQEDREYPGEAPWSIEQIPYRLLDRSRVQSDRQLFYLLTSASFIEITSDLYTRNLVEFFGDDDEMVDWLINGWEPEELQHGLALKRYVQAAWPAFDWERTYRSFFAEYAGVCLVETLETCHSLELAARCVIETGTSSFYRMIAEASDEPVLTELAGHIAADEVRHYKHFYRYFRKYCEREQPGRLAIFRTLLRRTTEIQSEDALIAFKHIYLAENAHGEFDSAEYDTYRKGIKRLAKEHFPQEMATKMILKPLGLGPTAGRMIVPVVTSVWNWFLG